MTDNSIAIGSSRLRRAAMLGLLAAAAGFSQQTKRVDDRALRDAPKNGDEWLTYGRDYAETHYSPLSQINVATSRGWALRGRGIPTRATAARSKRHPWSQTA